MDIHGPSGEATTWGQALGLLPAVEGAPGPLDRLGRIERALVRNGRTTSLWRYLVVAVGAAIAGTIAGYAVASFTCRVRQALRP